MAGGSAGETRRELVELGVSGLLELTPAQLLSAVGIKEIAAGAGVSPAALYHHFGTLEGYAQAVVDRVFDAAEFPTDEIVDRIGRVRSSTLPVEVGLATHGQEFARLSGDPELRVRLGLWALGGEHVDDAYAAFLRTVDQRIGVVVQALFESWGRELRPPFDMASFVAAEVALLTGSVIRHRIDPEVSNLDTFSRTALSLVAVALRLPGDRRTLDDRLTEINYYPLHHETGLRVTDPAQQARARVLDATAELLGRSDGERITVAQIARAADVSTSTLYRLFDGVDDIAVQLLVWQARDALARGPVAADPEPDPEDTDADAEGVGGSRALGARLRAVVQFVAPRHHHARAYVERLASRGAPVGDPLVAHVADGLDGDDERAELLVLLAVRHVLRHPADGPDGTVRHLGALGLLGP